MDSAPTSGSWMGPCQGQGAPGAKSPMGPSVLALHGGACEAHLSPSGKAKEMGLGATLICFGV